MTDIMSVHMVAESATPATAKQINEQVQNSDDTVYVFYSHPSVYIASKLAAGISGEEACREWLNGINECFLAQKKNRRQIRLLCTEEAIEHQEELFNIASFTTNQIQELVTRPDEIMLLAGHYLTMQTTDISNCLERLEALTLHLSGKPYRFEINVNSVIGRTMEFSEEQQDRLEMLFVEKQTLKQKTDEQAAKITELRGWCKVHEEREEKLKSEIESVTRERDEALAGVNSKNEEVTRVKEQLDQVQRQLETTYIKGHEEQAAKITELRGWCKVHEEREEKLKSEIERVTRERDEALARINSKNEEVTRVKEQLDKVQLQLESLATQRDEATKQNYNLTDELAVMQQQLDQVQVQLENTFIDSQEKAKDLNKAKDKVRELQKWCRIHESRQSDLNEKLLQYQQRNEDLERETHQLVLLNKEQREKSTHLTNELNLERERAREQIANLNIQLAQSFEEVKAHSIKNKNLRRQWEQSTLHSNESETPKETSTATDPSKNSNRSKQFLSKLRDRLRFGKRKPAEKELWVREQVLLLEESPLFDADWYLKQYPDLETSKLQPAEHYLRFGGFEGRNPNSQFDSAFYLSTYPDVAEEGMNPLIHFILYGEAEGRSVKPKANRKSRKDA
ncbi:hypothetical protein DFP83_11430 [Idiomarina fontislapidosi]|nr:hypothetical protein DFP83_11430 [Idiomarina fontislapidosi]